MRFIVYGAGAIGSTIGGHLFRTGHNVVLVGNPRHIDRIHKSGLKLDTPDETYILKVPACKEAKELVPFTDDDVVLLTAKSQHTILCLGQLKNAGASRSLPIFCCQNSILNESVTTRIFDRVYGVILRVSGIFLEPGIVINPTTGNAGYIEVGLYPRGLDRLAQTVSDALKKAGFVGGVNEWVMKAKGAKCLGNLGNAMDAITNSRGGDAEKFIIEARREAMAVWSAAGIEWEDLESFNKRVQKSRGINKMPKGYGDLQKFSSSWQSLIRETGNIEAEQLNGDVVKLGRLLDFPTPYNEVLWQVAEEMASKKERPGRYSVKDLTEMVKRRV